VGKRLEDFPASLISKVKWNTTFALFSESSGEQGGERQVKFSKKYILGATAIVLSSFLLGTALASIPGNPMQAFWRLILGLQNSDFQTQIDSLATSQRELQAKVDSLEANANSQDSELAQLKANASLKVIPVGLPAPDYVSDWLYCKGYSGLNITQGLRTTDVLIYGLYRTGNYSDRVSLFYGRDQWVTYEDHSYIERVDSEETWYAILHHQLLDEYHYSGVHAYIQNNNTISVYNSNPEEVWVKVFVWAIPPKP
jgi:hypothetical protein